MRVNNNITMMTMPVGVRVQAQQAVALRFGTEPPPKGSVMGGGGRGGRGRTINHSIQL